ncbi:MAG: 2'-deoxycytidine 5'-triphosphate deaminase, partial [Acidobacteria bacterium]|nr:2'-deoxycytidine 5'-triphosphate deaminase [Acidobacteriota bacterium]
MNRESLFPELTGELPLARKLRESWNTGVFPSQKIREFIDKKQICASSPITEAQVQPASLDLRLGPVAYRVRASFLPGKFSTAEEKIRELGMMQIDLREGAVFEKRCVYIVPLMEEWYLPENISGKANPKSTTGRLDIFTRLITDYGLEFEWVSPGYKGKLYAEVVPRTFTIAVREG